MWVHCGAAATAWSVLRQLWQIVRRVQLGNGSLPVQWLCNPCQCAPPPPAVDAMTARERMHACAASGSLYRIATTTHAPRAGTGL